MTPTKRARPSEYARRRYLDAGLEVLADRGHAGLKLAAVCEATGTTTGSFYHAFANWSEFTSALIGYWRDEKSRRPIAEARAVADPRERLDYLIDIGLRLPHESEAAIRVWAAHDPEVLEIQQAVDAERRAFIADTYAEVLGDASAANQFATAAMYLLIGYESGTLPSQDALATGFRSILSHALSTHTLPQ
ncbi:TetR/AcrR family transcriptional regulator [Gordonia rhizosphera]|uniref:Putative TetR family transcriptional regulator n=1 Tax=Gordonia rhizosphera NBRC 16068 TaxID=1108045 RepID=K6VV51_9ACTN|nr:TetR/AcrR family transcriptional regulator [Gordonia rhizosphera]GAB90765.1 putative TetR family transcriptional regulator [Gordonia rhizosphera NBRC 16068]